MTDKAKTKLTESVGVVFDEFYAIAAITETQESYKIRYVGDSDPDNTAATKYLSVSEAKSVIEELDDTVYVLEHDEMSRPEYYVVDYYLKDYIPGRECDGSNYSWDDHDSCIQGEDEACGECNECYKYMTWQDVEYIRKNAIEE